jgi:hypothetical protein
MGHLIPAGTGYMKHRNVKLVPLGEPVEQKIEVLPEEPVPAAS